MVQESRWHKAQQYEQGFWEGVAARIAEGSATQLDWYRWRAQELAGMLRSLGLAKLADGSARVLEVGSGPIGIVGYFPAKERIAIDPLENFYASNEVLTKLRDGTVTYLKGVGEDLPCAADSFDLAIIDNCIDHVQDVDAVMLELVRVLRSGGVTYLTVNTRTPWGFAVHRLLSRLTIDAGHPFTFTRGRVHSLVQRGGLEIVDFRTDSYLAAVVEDLKDPSLRARAKALLGVSEFLVTVVAKKPGIDGG